MDHFELHRQSDGLVYRFERVGPGLFRRMDAPDLTIAWEGHWGWVARLPETGAIAGRPWEILPEHQSADMPPSGIWISRKGDRSYIYELVKPQEALRCSA